jgi:hypothetical protein
MGGLPVSVTRDSARLACLNHRFGAGVQTLLWEHHEYPLPDAEAIAKTIAAVRTAHKQSWP